MKAFVWVLLVLFSLTAAAGLAQTQEEVIQLAILLDTSNSMDGLIDQAKSQLWKIVNELAVAEKNGRSPRLEVALYEYGNDSLSGSSGFVRKIVALTTDLDRVSEELFRLTTNGGDEYCGTVIQRAVRELRWSPSNADLKLIFIAGNEPFTQGRVDFKTASREAISQGIIVNTIFCGDYQEGIQTEWKRGADLADGAYMNIDQNQTIAYVEAPQDAEILRLNGELNDTYLAYGNRGAEFKERQEEQDSNAMSMSTESIIQRSVTKSKKQYSNESWDLVDALAGGVVKLEELKAGELPEEMRKMSPAERDAHVEAMLAKRTEIQQRIDELNGERRSFIEAELKNQVEKNTLDSAIIEAIKNQATARDFDFRS